MNFDTEISKMAFIFLSIGIIFSGYVANMIPCQLQKIMKNNIYAHHIVGILIFFIFIMLEGGWELTNKYEDIETNWSNGNVVSSLLYGIILHIIFVLTSKMKYNMSAILYLALFILYFIHTYRLNLLLKNEITGDINNYIIDIQKIIIVFIVIITIIGITDYYMYQKKELRDNFSYLKFILGNTKCSSV